MTFKRWLPKLLVLQNKQLKYYNVEGNEKEAAKTKIGGTIDPIKGHMPSLLDKSDPDGTLNFDFYSCSVHLKDT